MNVAPRYASMPPVRLAWRWIILSGAIVATAGCSGYTGPRSVVNEDPAVKIPEIRKAVDRGDQSVVPQLVKDLDNDDPAVRLYASQALKRLTGQSFEYDWTLTDRAARRPAIERWQAYVDTNPAAKP